MTIPFLLAPMAELSHRALREFFIENFCGGGCDLYYTEMISAGALLAGGPWERYYLDAGPRPEKTVYQLVGGDAEKLSAACALLDEKPQAGIDLNMGCAAPAIRRAGAGVAWMASIDRAGDLIRLVRPRLKNSVLSVKLRIGFSDDPDYLIRFCRRLEEEGVDRIALHPRRADEKFRRAARWELLAPLRAALKIPVYGNGDVDSAQTLVRRAGLCDGVMVGRQAVRTPWLFAQARGLLPPGTRLDLEALGLRFLDLLVRYQPPEFHLSRARRFFSYFCDNLTWATHVKNLLNRETSLSGMAARYSAFFQACPEERCRVLG